MEFLKVYVMTALPALLAFVSIWRFMTVSVVASSPEGAARMSEADGPEARVEPAGLRRAA